jgi:hypothetical protein
MIVPGARVLPIEIPGTPEYSFPSYFLNSLLNSLKCPSLNCFSRKASLSLVLPIV